MIEDWHGFGPDYDRTLQAWRANIESRLGPVASTLRRALPADVAFLPRRIGMATFRARRTQLWQLVLSPHGVPGGYIAPR